MRAGTAALLGAIWLLVLGAPGPVQAGPGAEGGDRPSGAPRLLAGAARADITPPPGLPLWGYGGRKDAPAQGVLEPLGASCAVIAAGPEKLALVGLDLGRAPARATMDAIRRRVREEAGVERVMVSGSHTHHGPCLELEKSEPTASYVRELEARISAIIIEAARRAEPARVAAGSTECPRNRNRHTKIPPRPVDSTLTVLWLESLASEPIATVVNYAAHPTTLPAELMKYTPDYPGALRKVVEKELGGVCVFLQGAAGDLSTDRHGLNTHAYGEALGRDVVALVRSLAPQAPEHPALTSREEELRFAKRVDFEDPLRYLLYTGAFFKDLVDAYIEEYRDGIRPSLSVAVLKGVNGTAGFVGVSGEFFCGHALGLRRRARLEHLFFVGYCNGYHQYFPTVEAVVEGGYGADERVAPVEVGAGERMMDRAVFHLYDLRKELAAR